MHFHAVVMHLGKANEVKAERKKKRISLNSTVEVT